MDLIHLWKCRLRETFDAGALQAKTPGSESAMPGRVVWPIFEVRLTRELVTSSCFSLDYGSVWLISVSFWHILFWIAMTQNRIRPRELGTGSIFWPGIVLELSIPINRLRRLSHKLYTAVIERRFRQKLYWNLSPLPFYKRYDGIVLFPNGLYSFQKSCDLHQVKWHKKKK